MNCGIEIKRRRRDVGMVEVMFGKHIYDDRMN